MQNGFELAESVAYQVRVLASGHGRLPPSSVTNSSGVLDRLFNGA
jgi:hypothetical protein